MSPSPPVCANGVHSEVTKRTRFKADGAELTGAGVAVLTAGGLSMDRPALAADSDASAIRTRALGDTGRGSTLEAGGCGFFASVFFLDPDFPAATSGVPLRRDLPDELGTPLLLNTGAGGAEVLWFRFFSDDDLAIAEG
jgi:hypothetical protein